MGWEERTQYTNYMGPGENRWANVPKCDYFNLLSILAGFSRPVLHETICHIWLSLSECRCHICADSLITHYRRASKKGNFQRFFVKYYSAYSSLSKCPKQKHSLPLEKYRFSISPGRCMQKCLSLDCELLMYLLLWAESKIWQVLRAFIPSHTPYEYIL